MTTRALALAALFVASVAASACARSRPSDTDAAPGTDSAPGTDAGTDAGSGSLWDPCKSNDECASNTCIALPGDPQAHCTEYCTNLCPDGFECTTVPISPGVEVDVCAPAGESFCDPCDINRDCGDSSDLCIDLTAGRFCSIDCRDDPMVCPAGFTCQYLGNMGDFVNVWQCMPLNGICCIDGDGDLRGMGAGCVTTDCDDSNPDIYDDAVEICDGLDNDCIGGVDVGVTDCAGPDCAFGIFGYYETPAEPCIAGVCEPQSIELCDLYTCAGGGDSGDECATLCAGEDDTLCIPPAHCEADACFSDLADGLACDEASDCTSDHCQNGFCCAAGDCCAVASDCPTFGTIAPICEDPTTCQGTRGDAACVVFRCEAVGGLADDSACTASTLASDCGFYLPIFCTGAEDQSAPSCPTSCASNADCDAVAFCDVGGTDTCLPDLPNGDACGADADRCVSAHCQNGFCCDSGDCCATEANCPASYSSDPVCTTPTACQGDRDVAQCLANTCTTSANVPDDSACDSSVVASDCGFWLSVACDGLTSQPPAMCPTTCTANLECDAGAYCNSAGACEGDEADGQACSDAAACLSGHCQNGFCCASGDCCAVDGNCGAYAVAPGCDDPASCQGTRIDGNCNAAFACEAVVVDDDSGCAGLPSNDCGPYPTITCTSAPVQPAGQSGLCAMSCTGDPGCDFSAHCTAMTCQPDIGPGGFCTTASECTAGLFCADNVCCNTACGGGCAACDLAGSVGTCTLIPDGTDPDNECGFVSCTGYYSGWSGDSCLRKANVSAGSATCGGDGACRTTAEECTAQTMTGSTSVTCNAVCQDPNLGTCSGTTAGTCTNVNPGTQGCGDGVCAVTVPICVGGLPNMCVPNWAAMSTETCNNVDDDCDGTSDNGAFEDTFETNEDCSSYKSFPSAGSDVTLLQNMLTVYVSGDHDYFRIPTAETDSSCACCDFFCTDEDYRLTITLTVPSGAGSYMFCTNTSCGAVDANCQEILAGGSGSWIWTFDGACGSTDSYSTYVHVYGDNAPGFECSYYTISYFFDSGLCL